MTRAVFLSLVLLSFAACQRTPTEPSMRPLHLTLAGQSNAALLTPFLAELADVTGAGNRGATPIACWAPDAECWNALGGSVASLPKPQAFIWWQGESDTENQGYGPLFADLMARVRQRAGNPELLILVMQWGYTYTWAGRGQWAQDAQRAWVSQDAHALWLQTQDAEYRPDLIHMTDRGYRMIAARIVAAVEARR